MKTFIASWHKPRLEFQCPQLRSRVPISPPSQTSGNWNQSRLAGARIVFAGAGVIGSQILRGEIRLGIGTADIVDNDIVDEKNLGRQEYGEENLFRPKAIELAKNLEKQGWHGTKIIAHPCSIQEIDLKALKPDLVCLSVDEKVPGTVEHVCRICHEAAITLVVNRISPDAYGYTFIQSPLEACWRCCFPEEKKKNKNSTPPCVTTPSTLELAFAVAGQAMFGIHSVLMNRKRDWNFKVVSFRSDFGGGQWIAKKPDCPICGKCS